MIVMAAIIVSGCTVHQQPLTYRGEIVNDAFWEKHGTQYSSGPMNYEDARMMQLRQDIRRDIRFDQMRAELRHNR